MEQNDPRLALLNKEIDETKLILKENTEKVIDRDNNLNELDHKSARLNLSAERFRIKSRNLKMKHDIHRVSIGNSDIADILVLRSDELYIVGKTLGHTNVMMWDENDKVIDVFNLEISHDLNGLRERLGYPFIIVKF